jgi:hypothetical protein
MERISGSIDGSWEVDVEFLDGKRVSFDEMIPEGIFRKQ